jgi:hypothetical protein
MFELQLCTLMFRTPALYMPQPKRRQYREASYWDDRYAREPVTFDWCAPGSAARQRQGETGCSRVP